MSLPTRLLGVDFTSAPTRRKPITIARGHWDGGLLRLDGVDACTDMAAFESALSAPGPWLGAFDFPFGLPRAFVDAFGAGRRRGGRQRRSAPPLRQPDGLSRAGRRLGPRHVRPASA